MSPCYQKILTPWSNSNAIFDISVNVLMWIDKKFFFAVPAEEFNGIIGIRANNTLIKSSKMAIRTTTYHVLGRYHQEQSSHLITLKSQIFPVKNANLLSSGLVGLVAKSSVFKLGNFCNLLSSHLRFWVSFNLLSAQRLIFTLPKNPVTPPCFNIGCRQVFRLRQCGFSPQLRNLTCTYRPD